MTRIFRVFLPLALAVAAVLGTAGAASAAEFPPGWGECFWIDNPGQRVPCPE